jgi:type II secretory pathway pseudopilin PulG
MNSKMTDTKHVGGSPAALRNKKATQAFTTVELVIGLIVLGILAGASIMGGPALFRLARVHTAANDYQTLVTTIADASQKCGGTLPITEGGAALPTTSGANCGTSTAANFYNNARLEQVLMAVPSPMMTKYYNPGMGSQTFTRADGLAPSTGDLTYNSTTSTWSSVGADTTVTAVMSYAAVSRLECATITANVPGTDGTNFKLNGATSLPLGGRVAYIVYKGVSGLDAYSFAAKINGTALMTDTSGAGTVAQTIGLVSYAAVGANGTTDVYAYLGNF